MTHPAAPDRELAGPRAVAVAVVGSGECGPHQEVLAEEVGRRLAEAGALVVTGGLGGVMAAASRGARAAGGTTVGLLPGEDRDDANSWVAIAVPTGLGEARNVLVVRAADVLVAVGGEYGTLSEIALALKLGRPVVGIETWELRRPGGTETDIGTGPGTGAGTGPGTGVRPATDAASAVALALELAAASGLAGDAAPP